MVHRCSIAWRIQGVVATRCSSSRRSLASSQVPNGQWRVVRTLASQAMQDVGGAELPGEQTGPSCRIRAAGCARSTSPLPFAEGRSAARRTSAVVAGPSPVLARSALVVAAADGDADLALGHLVDEAVLFGDATGPVCLEAVPERLRLANFQFCGGVSADRTCGDSAGTRLAEPVVTGRRRGEL